MRRGPSSSGGWRPLGVLLPLLGMLSLSACKGEPPVPAPPVVEPTPEPEPTPPAPAPIPVPGSFTNPVRAAIPGGGRVENCPDPTVIQEQGGERAWYVFCTSDPLNDEDRHVSREYRQHVIPILKSLDLVEWTYVGDALRTLPSWAQADSDVWAPEVVYFNNKYYLYYSVVKTKDGREYAIGVATSDSLAGPWVSEERPAVEPHERPCCANGTRWTIDPEVLLTANGKKYIYYGSYSGGVSVRELSADGLISDPYTQVEVTVANRYEAPSLVEHDGYYYLLVSAADCCNGPLTGYSVFAGRSKSPTGPFVDREGVRLTLNRVGGTPVLGANGNRWVGTGHNTVFKDAGGQEWILYHAMDRTNPYLARAPDGGLPPKRQLLMDALDWVDGWPVVRGGQGPSDTAQPAPSVRAGEVSRYTPSFAAQDLPGALLDADDFEGGLKAFWSWTRAPAAEVKDGVLRFATQDADLHEDKNSASILWKPAPAGDFLVEAKLTLDLPPVSCCHNYVQAGLIVLKDDDNYVRLTHVSQWETRQIAFSKEEGPSVPAGYPRYGETFGGPADQTVWLRIARRTRAGEELYTAYSSRDGVTWSRTATWTHALGMNARLGLVSMGGPGFTALFDDVRVYALKP